MPPYDEEAMMRGTVPWTAGECAEVLKWYRQTLGAPKDDWDLKEHDVSLQNDDGKILSVQFNMLHPMNQLGWHMAERYPPQVMPYHLYRLMMIMRFLRDHQEDLVNDGLGERGAKRLSEIRDEVLEALCILPYTKTVESSAGEDWLSFDYDQVVSKALERMNDAGETDESL